YTDSPIGLWVADTGERVRLLAAVSGLGDGDTTLLRDAWIWPNLRARQLPGLARYLLYSAKLAYERRVFESEVGKLRKARDSVLDDVDRLINVSKEKESRRHTPHVLELEDAKASLSESQAGADGLVKGIYQLHSLSRTIEIAATNIEGVTPAAWPGWQ